MIVAKHIDTLRRISAKNSDSLLFFIGSVVAAGTNFLFQALMGRLLGPNVYGALGSLLGLVTIFSLVASALQLAITHAVASNDPQQSDIRPDLSLRRPFIRLILASVVLFGVVAVATPALKHYLHLHSIVPVLLFGVFISLSIVSIIPRAVLFGRMQFSTVAIGLIVNGVSRCVFGVLFVELHLGLDGATLATVFGAALQIVVYAKPIRTELLKLGPIQERLVRYRSVLLATMSLGGVSAFIGVDSVLARHYLPGKESGYYVAAATGARIALFLPGAIQQMAFPRLTRTIDKPLENRKMFRQNLVIVAILAAGATIGILLFSHVVLAILFGSKFRSAAPTIRILALSAAEMGVISYFTYYFLAHKSAFAVISWIGVVGAAIFIWQFHSDPAQIAEMMFGATSATLLFQWYGLWRLR